MLGGGAVGGPVQMLLGVLFGELFVVQVMVRAQFCKIDSRVLYIGHAVWRAGAGAVLGVALLQD